MKLKAALPVWNQPESVMQKEALTDKEFDYEMWDSVQTRVKYGLCSVGIPMEVGDSAAQN